MQNELGRRVVIVAAPLAATEVAERNFQIAFQVKILCKIDKKMTRK